MAEAPAASIDAALAQAVKLLRDSPALAERQALEILRVVPGDPRAMLILGGARRRAGNAAAAREVLAPLARAQPGAPLAHQELGLVLVMLGEADAGLASLRRAVGLKQALPDAWRAIADTLAARGDGVGADKAYMEMVHAAVADPELMAAADAMGDDRLAVAERLLRSRLKTQPTDVAAMRLLAEAGTRLGRYEDSESLLLRCLELAPSFAGARYNLAVVLYRQQKAPEALVHLERLAAAEPNNLSYRNLIAACLGLVGEYDRAIRLYEGVLAETPAQPKIWLSYGHALKTAGRGEDAVAAYNRCIELAPNLGEAYWSLANLKTTPTSAAHEARMRAELERPDLGTDDRLHLHYALGKAMEDRGEWQASFDHYSRGAAVRRQMAPYDADDAHAEMLRGKHLFSKAFISRRMDTGSTKSDPIFIVGLPRSGSTLIEQILASHSQVEGTMELPDLSFLARRLGRVGARIASEPRYPDVLSELDPAALTALGDEYIERTRIHRKRGTPFFIDKMPNNFQHIGLIQLILPKARIIDARRSPMASCFSAFKQHFARGHAYSYDLGDLGRYYRDYVELMAHFDDLWPGRIHRTIYETLVDDTEAEVRRLLDYCGLEFEPACLRFHENPRAVRTASSEQVRQPIFRDGLDRWRRYEPWLGPLRMALGSDLAEM